MTGDYVILCAGVRMVFVSFMFTFVVLICVYMTFSHFLRLRIHGLGSFMLSAVVFLFEYGDGRVWSYNMEARPLTPRTSRNCQELLLEASRQSSWWRLSMILTRRRREMWFGWLVHLWETLQAWKKSRNLEENNRFALEVLGYHHAPCSAFFNSPWTPSCLKTTTVVHSSTLAPLPPSPSAFVLSYHVVRNRNDLMF